MPLKQRNQSKKKKLNRMENIYVRFSLGYSLFWFKGFCLFFFSIFFYFVLFFKSFIYFQF